MLNKELIDSIEQKHFFPGNNIRISGISKKMSCSLSEVYRNVSELVKIRQTCSAINYKDEICPANKHRSFIDIFRICRYYTKCTLYEFIEMLQSHNTGEYYCPQIKRCILVDMDFNRPAFYRMYTTMNLVGRKHEEFDGLTFEELTLIKTK